MQTRECQRRENTDIGEQPADFYHNHPRESTYSQHINSLVHLQFVKTVLQEELAKKMSKATEDIRYGEWQYKQTCTFLYYPEMCFEAKRMHCDSRKWLQNR